VGVRLVIAGAPPRSSADPPKRTFVTPKGDASPTAGIPLVRPAIVPLPHSGDMICHMEATGLTPEDLFAIRLIGAPVFSPDGEAILVTEQWLDPKDNRSRTRLLLCGAADGSTRPFTQGPSDRQAAWSPDGSRVAFLRGVEGIAQVFLMAAHGGEPHQATRLRHGVAAIRWTADGSGLIMSAPLSAGQIEEGASPEPAEDFERYTADVRRVTKLFHKLDGEGFFDGTHTALLHMDADSGELAVLESGDYDCSDPAVSPHGDLIAYTSRRLPDPDRLPAVMDIYVLPLAGGEPRRLTQGQFEVRQLAWSPDGQMVYFTASDPNDHGYGHVRLYRVSLAGALEPLSGELDRTLEDVSGTDIGAPERSLIAFAGESVYCLGSSEGRVSIYARDGCGGWTREISGDRCIYGFDYHPARGFAIAYADFGTPSALALSGPGGEQLLLRGEMPERVQRAFAQPEHFTARAEGGPQVDCWLLLPDAPREKVPLVLEVHGGPMAMYGMRAHFEFQILRAQGYAVLFSNPRGSQGYAESFCNAIVGRWGDKDYRDVLAALDGALSRFPQLDPLRLGIAGGSYGGFIVNWAIGHTGRFRAAVAMRSVVNRMSAMGSSDVGFERVPQYGALWWEDPAPYLQQSPLTYASNIHTPVLIEHQEQDLRLPIEQGEQLFTALKYLGRTVEMLRYPGESHGMSRTGKPWHRVHRLRAIQDWFSRYL
jgi:dipeptidyl aminopeptidase/acylaminoacyl peptidase